MVLLWPRSMPVREGPGLGQCGHSDTLEETLPSSRRVCGAKTCGQQDTNGRKPALALAESPMGANANQLLCAAPHRGSVRSRLERRERISSLSHRLCFNMRVVARHGCRIVSDEFLNDGRADASILHETGRRVTQAVE